VAYKLEQARPKTPPQKCTGNHDKQKEEDYNYSYGPPLPIHISPPLEHACANWIGSNIVLALQDLR
jgi:hypothetical protein